MTTYSIEALRSALQQVGIGASQLVLIHSSLMGLGRLQNCPPRESVARIFDLLREMLGPSGTIVVPTFNFDFCRGIPFDIVNTPSKGMGSFSEYVRTRPGACRSGHPMQSVTALGPLAAQLCAADTLSSFDPNGPFSRMLQQGGLGLLLGAPMQSFSLVHLIEERCRVPYRYWKTFSAPYGNPSVDRTYKMYVRDLEKDPRPSLERTKDFLVANKMMRSERVGAGTVRLFRLADFLAVTMEQVSANPNWLIE